MAKDAELDRLKAAQDLAFQRKQTAHQAQQHAWEAKTSAREALNRAHEAKQSAYTNQDATWQDCQRVRSSNGPRIEQLNTQQERAFENMKSAFDSASAAHDRRDGASASSYASQGHAYKTESQGYVAERRQLVEAIRTARAKHEASKPAFQRAKDDFNSAKNTFDAAKTNHDRAQVEFKRAKAEFDQAAKAFKARLDLVKAQNTKKANDKRSIAERAGVPYQYRDDIWVSKEDSDGSINIYFGGAGKSDGPGHGHYTLDRNGNVTYKREPYDSHGVQNFQEAEGAALLYIRSARRDHQPLATNEHGGVFHRRSDNGNTVLHITQYFADNYHVSWDATSIGNVNIHWTNKNVPKWHSDRFTPPSDAML
jgi:hypothetical protein